MANELDKFRVKMLCGKSRITMGQLAAGFGITQSTLSIRLSKPRFTIEEQQKVAEVLGCKFYPVFIYEDGTEITGGSVKEIAKQAAAISGINFSHAAQILGKSRQNFSLKISRGHMNAAELADLAKVFNCTYDNWYIYDDGTKL